MENGHRELNLSKHTMEITKVQDEIQDVNECKITHIERNKRYRKNLKLRSTVYNYPAQVCKREGTASIVWSDKYWEKIKKIIASRSIDKEKVIVLQ